MQTNPNFFTQVRDLIARNELPTALGQLRNLLFNSPLLSKVINQSGRFQDIQDKIHAGTVTREEAEVTQNKIRAGVLDLLTMMERQVGADGNLPEMPALQAEFEQAVSIMNSENVVVGSTIQAGGNVQIGNITYQNYERKVPHTLTQPPFLPEIFFGREQDIKQIYERLFSPDSNPLLLINGEGGIGKSALASKYYHTYKEAYAHVAWVFSEKSISNAILLLATPLGLIFEKQMTIDERLESLLSAIANLPKPGLLIIDNVNELEDLEHRYLLLRRCDNFHLLLTTRIRDFENAPDYPIEGLPESEALALFEQHYRPLPDDERALFLQIRDAVGGNTLVLELLAKNLAGQNRLRSRYSLAELLADLQGRGLLQLSQSREVNTDYQCKEQMRRETPESIIAAMYDLGELPHEDVALLSVFAVLPAEMIPFQVLETLLPDWVDLEDGLLALSRKGWIEYIERSYAFKCSPVVQDVVQQKNEGLKADCTVLVNKLIEKMKYGGTVRYLLNATYDEASLFARYAETVLAVFTTPDDNLSLLYERLIHYYNITDDFAKALVIGEKGKQIAQALYLAEPENVNFKNGLAILYEKLGKTHKLLGKIPEALAFFEQFNQLEKELHESYPENPQFTNILAVSFEKLGTVHRLLGNMDKALAFFEQYNQLRESLYKSDPQNMEFKNGLAVSYSKLGDTHSSLKHVEEALTFFEDYNRLEKELCESDPQNMEFKNGLANSYGKLGNTHSLLGNFDKALAYYEQYNNLEKELCASDPQNEELKNGLAISYVKLGEIHRAFGNLDKALTFFEQYNQLEKELYESSPQNVEFKNGLAISYSLLGRFYRDKKGDLAAAYSYFEQCQSLWEELTTTLPNHAQFRKNLEFAQTSLAGLK